MDWAANDLAERDLYKLLVNTVLPRPIALVTTVDAQGRANAAPSASSMSSAMHRHWSCSASRAAAAVHR